MWIAIGAVLGFIVIIADIIIIGDVLRRRQRGRSSETKRADLPPPSSVTPADLLRWAAEARTAGRREGMEIEREAQAKRRAGPLMTAALHDSLQGIHEHAYDLGAADRGERIRLALIEESNKEGGQYFIQGVLMKSGATEPLGPEQQRMILTARAEALLEFARISHFFVSPLPDGSVYALLARGAAQGREDVRQTALLEADLAREENGRRVLLDFAKILETERGDDPEISPVLSAWQSAVVHWHSRCNSLELRNEELTARLTAGKGAAG